MDYIWVSEIVFKPTGPLTFRQMPSGLLHIMTYPFMPPTTMSGFVTRLLAIAGGGDWPGYGDEWFGKAAGNHFTLTLDPACRALGAYPGPDQWRVHKTRRHGPKNFKHADFSRVLRTDHKENYQLHHWDYLLCEELTGWIVAEAQSALAPLASLPNIGGKAGKEGWLFVARVQGPHKALLCEGPFVPAGLVTPPLRPRSGRFFNLYGHHWNKTYQWVNGDTGGVDGFTQVGAWWQADTVKGPYWALPDGRGIAAHVPDAFLQGDVAPFYGPSTGIADR